MHVLEASAFAVTHLISHQSTLGCEEARSARIGEVEVKRSAQGPRLPNTGAVQHLPDKTHPDFGSIN
jgi:hypothetical protein